MNRDLTVLENMFKDVFSFDTQDVAHRLHVDWDSTDDGYIVMAEIPGITEDQLEVNIENGMLTIRADYGDGKLRQGKFKWAAKVNDIDSEAITAKLENGILELNLPKSEKAKPKKITISKK